MLVHGTAADHGRWNIALPRLSSRFTCYAVDRRGRGDSGDARDYGLVHEVEDLVAVIESVPGPVRMVAHSFGGLVAMEAAALTDRLSHLVLYEPAAFVPGNEVYEGDIIDELDWMLATGDREGLVARMLREVAGIPERNIELIRRQPYWAQRVATAATIPRELRVDRDYRPDPEELGRIQAKTLFIVGSESPTFYHDGAIRLASMIPDATIRMLDRHGHAGIDTGTRAFLDLVLEFLAS